MIPIYAQRIREVRQSVGMTQTDFALKIGTTKNQLSKYELGTQETPIRIITAICIYFDIDANWLLGLEGDIDGKYDAFIINTKNPDNKQDTEHVFRMIKVKRK